ncbi:MAG: DUF4129 domain-containing protein [Bacteroidetes bacterium]|nr:DUF4129 domain-containing protein [Bacteroidota bacterium]
MSRFLLLFFFSCLSVGFSWAGAEKAELFYLDSSDVSERQMDTSLLNKRMQEEAFQYNRAQIETDDTFDRLVAWIMEQLFGDFDREDMDTAKNVIFWIVLILVLIGASYYIFKMNPARFLKKDNSSIQEVRFMDYTGNNDDLEKSLRQAEANGDYPLALRYLFITALSFLEKEGIIQWKAEKTNADYLRELKEEWSQTPMTRLSQLFSYGYYGNYPISKELYEEAKALFQRLKKKGGLAK